MKLGTGEPDCFSYEDISALILRAASWRKSQSYIRSRQFRLHPYAHKPVAPRHLRSDPDARLEPFHSIVLSATNRFLLCHINVLDLTPAIPATMSNSSPESTPTWAEQPMGQWNRKLRVVTIGAGFTGINMAYNLRRFLPNVDHTVYEKNTGVGGTWLVSGLS